jgi:hypothetical protein
MSWQDKFPDVKRRTLQIRVFENRVLRRIFGPKTDEIIGGWRKLRKVELHNLYIVSIYPSTQQSNK